MQHKPKLSLIAAMDKNRVIGYQNQMPWHLPADLKHFKQLTLDKPILMGRNTYASIGKPLPQRPNWILSRDPNFSAEGCDVFNSIEEVFQKAVHIEEIMVIGGATLYEQLLPKADTLYLTFIDHAFKGDTYFPDWKNRSWKETERIHHSADEKNPYSLTFVTLQAK